MYAEPNDVILLTVGIIPLTVTVLMQCASGKRRKKNLSNTKSKVTQSSVSSSQSMKKTSKLQKNKVERDAEKSPRSFSNRKGPIQKRPLAIGDRSDDESLRSSKSEAYCKMRSRSDRSQAKGRNGDASIKASGKPVIVTPVATAGTPKDVQIAGLTNEKTISKKEIKGAIFKEQEQNTQQNICPINEKEEQELTVEPKNLRWSDEGGYQRVQLRNITKERLAVKAKCSDNQLYRVNPVFGFIDPGEQLKVDIMRRKAVPKVDKMVFVSVHANKDDIFPKPLFKRSKDSQKMAMLPLLVARVI
ncbi:MSP (Major sperm protein) domain family protein [Acanthocheilonema viteae]